MLVDLQFVFVVSCCLLALSCRGGLRCHVGGYTWGRTINEPPPNRSPRRAELPLRVRNVCVLVEVRVVLVGLHGGWQPQTTKGEKGRVFGRLKSRHVEPP
jgi:hypothetical protein